MELGNVVAHSSSDRRGALRRFPKSRVMRADHVDRRGSETWGHAPAEGVADTLAHFKFAGNLARSLHVVSPIVTPPAFHIVWELAPSSSTKSHSRRSDRVLAADR